MSDNNRSDSDNVMSIVNRDNEIPPPEAIELNTTVTTSDSVIKTHDWSKHFPETDNCQNSDKGDKWIILYFCDSEEMIEKLSTGIHF